LLIRIGFIDEKGEPSVIPTGHYFDTISNKIYITTLKVSKKVNRLRKNNVIAYYIDDPSPPFRGLREKGLKIHEDINNNITTSLF
jgi:nitroimidazol reductase NimA-like FMN-containing flavoprotein (pyridoxamine 5'-phosphate oxidase superfamily)